MQFLMGSSLLIISECRSALAECRTLDDVLAIRDKMEAARQLMKVRGESLEAQNQAAEIKIRAERMLGTSLGKMEKNPGSRNGVWRLHDATAKLSDLGIEKTQSHRWQQMAKVPEATFAALVASATDDGDELTSVAVYKLGRKIGEDPSPKDSKSDWNAFDWIAHMRKAVTKVYEDCPPGCRAALPHVLREMSEEFLASEDDDGSGRGSRDDSAVGACSCAD